VQGSRTLGAVGLMLILIAGCDGDRPPAPTPDQPLAEAGRDFDPTTAGTVEGRVAWDGPVPEVPDFRSTTYPRDYTDHKVLSWPNPNAPRVDPASRGVEGAVVFLRGIDPRKARPWDLPPVAVVMRHYHLHVCQGETESRTGFVRRGTSIDMVSREATLHSLQGRGAAFFTLAFPDRDVVRKRRLDRAGVVELTSGVGCFWMRGHLFVDDHPYYARTDAAGRFRLERVPAGLYELVCWLPDWRAASHERDGDTCRIARLAFRPPLELTQAVTVTPGARAAVSFSPSTAAFDRR
jgi:hypothetical protein